MMARSLPAQIVRISRALHAMGWVANHDGNVSARASPGRVLITPTAVSKADVDESMLVEVDGAGEVLAGSRKPPGELDLHLAAYRARPDVRAVVHAHPPVATAFGVAGASLDLAVLPEIVVSLGHGVPTAPFAMPRTPEACRAVEETLQRADAILLPGNGVLTVGADLEQAYLRMELVEHFAKIVKAARELGGVKELTPEQVARLIEARRKAGLGAPAERAAEAAAAGSGGAIIGGATEAELEAIVRAVAARLR